MAVTINSPVQVDDFTWQLSWSSSLPGTPAYYVYRDGELVDTTYAQEKLIHVEADEAPIFEILDDSTAEPAYAYPAALTLRWYEVAATDRYEVQELVGAVWTTRAVITDSGQGYFAWRSRPLEDETVHQFRVRAIGTNGNTGTALTLSCLTVRNPDPPEATWSYSAVTKKVTIT